MVSPILLPSLFSPFFLFSLKSNLRPKFNLFVHPFLSVFFFLSPSSLHFSPRSLLFVSLQNNFFLRYLQTCVIFTSCFFFASCYLSPSCISFVSCSFYMPSHYSSFLSSVSPCLFCLLYILLRKISEEAEKTVVFFFHLRSLLYYYFLTCSSSPPSRVSCAVSS